MSWQYAGTPPLKKKKEGKKGTYLPSFLFPCTDGRRVGPKLVLVFSPALPFASPILFILFGRRPVCGQGGDGWRPRWETSAERRGSVVVNITLGGVWSREMEQGLKRLRLFVSVGRGLGSSVWSVHRETGADKVPSYHAVRSVGMGLVV